MSFKEVSIKDLNENFVKDIADEWMLVTAGDEKKHNMMTASWGFVGEMWGKDAAVTVIRPQRYTKEFIDSHDMFSLSFYGNDKKLHGITGSKSGREIDKTEATGLTPVYNYGTVYFEQARLVLICRKLYVSRLDPDKFIDKENLKWYESKDYHYAYVGDITHTLVKEQSKPE